MEMIRNRLQPGLSNRLWVLVISSEHGRPASVMSISRIWQPFIHRLVAL